MKTKEALETLIKAFSVYDFHPEFVNELRDLLKTDLRGKEARFFKCLATQLNYIKNLGILVNEADGHEIIHGFDGHYYSIHLQQVQFNIRFLVHIDSKNRPVFLCAFNERAGHRQTSYEKYTNVLTKRFKEQQGDDNDETNDEM